MNVTCRACHYSDEAGNCTTVIPEFGHAECGWCVGFQSKNPVEEHAVGTVWRNFKAIAKAGKGQKHAK